MNSPVNASLQNQSLSMDLRWVAKWVCKSARKFTQVAKVINFMCAYTQMTCNQLMLTCIG